MLLRSLLASVVYLVPVAVLLSLRHREDRSIWEMAGDIPAAIAADLLLVSLLSRFMILETAALASRGLWILGGAVALAYRRRRGQRLARWSRVPRAALYQGGLLALAALAASLTLSRPCAIWDREWHIPLVASLRGQRLPFMNVYEPSGGLYYHFTGDVLAAMLQAFSGDVLHASLALSLAHDLMFALVGAELGLFLWAVGVRRPRLAVLVLVATLFAGPVTLLREPGRKLESGHSIVNFLSLSFRPHVSLAYLLMLGVAGLLLALTQRTRAALEARRLWPPLVLCLAALVLTDESAVALLALGVGVVWLRDPGVLGEGRRRGLIVAAGMALVLAITVGLFVGAIGLHAPRYTTELVLPRSPGFLVPSVAFSSWLGPWLVAQDLWSILLVGAAGIALAAKLDGETRASVLFYSVVLGAAVLAFCCLEHNHAPIESHRWVTTPFAIAPLFAAAWLVAAGGQRGPSWAASWPALLVYAGCILGVTSTVEWLASGVALRECRRHQNFEGFGAADRFYDVDCRTTTGARLGESALVSYVESPGAYLYAGCRPTFVPGPASSLQKIKVGRLRFGAVALDDLDRHMLRPGEPLTVACLAGAPSSDVACADARARGGCAATGAAFETCVLSALDRARLMGRDGP